MSGTSFTERVLQLGLTPAEASRLLESSPSRLRGTGGDPAAIFAPVRHKVGMLFTSRSGTTFFVDVLNRSGAFGEIREHLNPYRQKTGAKKWKSASMADFVAETVRTYASPEGVFGFKGTVEALLPLAQVGELPDNAVQWSWITVHRRDIVAQAVSLFRAKATGVWHTVGKLAGKPPMPPYDYAGIEKQVDLIQRKQGQIERFIAQQDLTPLRLVYEDFKDDPTDALKAVFDHVGLIPPANLSALAAQGEFVVMADDQSRRYADRFRQESTARLG
ncbi:Stf0 family sulfotransferase [Microlunatus parietis]|uniref:LPS sulfotransferase NodH n=1 Tax=Microlunatus parietis TaxID=682979 RepID=A0A7Y9LBE5_9ACTN|nr:Stf0 family sulfotransferase [Microlunatus parietis]NYE70560.1 LPS sulfotransferase NodH [Microlunatus parietis]